MHAHTHTRMHACMTCIHTFDMHAYIDDNSLHLSLIERLPRCARSPTSEGVPTVDVSLRSCWNLIHHGVMRVAGPPLHNLYPATRVVRVREVRIKKRHRAKLLDKQSHYWIEWLQPSNIEHRTVELSYSKATPRIFLLLNFLLFVLLPSSASVVHILILHIMTRQMIDTLLFLPVHVLCSCLTAALKMNGSHVIRFFLC